MRLADQLKERQRARIIAEGRKLKPSDFLSADVASKLPDEPCLLVVSLTVAESDQATDAALRYKKQSITQLGERARDLIDEPSLFADADAVERLYRACRKPDEPSERAFASADELRELFTTEELAVLYSVQVETQQSSSPLKTTTLHDREVIASIIANTEDSPELQAYLARFPRMLLSDLLIWACKDRKIARELADVLSTQAAG